VDALGRIGTTDGPGYFEDRQTRVRVERAERKRAKEQAKLAAQREAAAAQQLKRAAEHTGDEDGSRDPSTYAEWLQSPRGPLHSSLSGRAYPEIAAKCAEAVGRWRERFPQEVWLRTVKRGRLLKELLERWASVPRHPSM
jgi:hypothetical protein